MEDLEKITNCVVDRVRSVPYCTHNTPVLIRPIKKTLESVRHVVVRTFRTSWYFQHARLFYDIKAAQKIVLH